MRTRALAWAVAVLALAVPARAGAPRIDGLGVPSAQVRKALEGHALHGLDGSVLDLESLRGRVVVVNFWATWCPPCRRELPRLDALARAIASDGGRVIAVSIDNDLENVRRFARANRITLPLYHDGPDGLARELDLQHVPLTLVLARDGAVAYAAGGSGAEALARLESRTRELLAQPPMASGSDTGDTP